MVDNTIVQLKIALATGCDTNNNIQRSNKVINITIDSDLAMRGNKAPHTPSAATGRHKKPTGIMKLL